MRIIKAFTKNPQAPMLFYYINLRMSIIYLLFLLTKAENFGIVKKVNFIY